MWGLIIILFGCIGQIIFFELKDFKGASPVAGLTYLVQAALGGWDMDIFLLKRKYSCAEGSTTDCFYRERGEFDKNTGRVFMASFLILNMVVIINLVIAILATTYNEFSTYERGLYYDTLIQALPINKNHKHFGFMVCAPSVLSFFILLISPLMYFC